MTRSPTRLLRRRLRALAEREDAEPLDGLRARLVVGAMFAIAPRLTRQRGVDKLDGAVEWRITRPDGGASLRTMDFGDGRLRIRRHVRAEPDLTLVLSASDFFRLALGAVDIVTLTTKGRVTIHGDLDFGMRVPGAFGRR